MATLENTTIKVESVAEIQDAVRSHDRVARAAASLSSRRRTWTQHCSISRRCAG
ncbi:MAG: hypothetical protein R2856_21650 [Caldilineaceae bacterium]